MIRGRSLKDRRNKRRRRNIPPLFKPKHLQADSVDGPVLVKVLRKQTLPHIEPLLLLGSEQFARLLEASSEQFAQPCAQDFDDEHRLPIRDGEATPITIQHYHARV